MPSFRKNLDTTLAADFITATGLARRTIKDPAKIPSLYAPSFDIRFAECVYSGLDAFNNYTTATQHGSMIVVRNTTAAAMTTDASDWEEAIREFLNFTYVPPIVVPGETLSIDYVVPTETNVALYNDLRIAILVNFIAVGTFV